MGSAYRMKRPEHIAKIGECITLWPEVETQLALLLAALTKADTTATLAVYSILRRSTGKSEAVKAAASVALDKSGQELVAAVLTFSQSVEGQRNDLAHGHWGISELIPDAILWLDGSYTTQFHVNHRQKVLIKNEQLDSDIESNLFYYKVRDFDELIKSTLSLCEAIFTVRAYVDSFREKNDYYTSSQLCAQLESYGPIRQALIHIRGRALLPTPLKSHQSKNPPLAG
jgi:hypothetical protein